MKALYSGIVAILLMAFFACKKTSFIESPDALLALSADTLHFDTVFTSTGSVTQLFKIFNLNDRKLRLSEIRLMGGNTSNFKINVDGAPGVNFSGIELAPNDSIYVFVSVTINPTAINLPFIVQDSILIGFNGNSRFLQLEAYGQNAHFLKGKRITTDTTWVNDLPYVVLDSLSVDNGASLTIQKGCRIFHHANAPFLVNGTLKINGDSLERVVFAADRLDPVYRDLPGSWPGIYIKSTSSNNELNFTIIKNAYQGISAESQTGTGVKIILNQCIINNISDAGIVASGSSIHANNCLISNCGSNVLLEAGGDYDFNHCTIVTYGNLFIDHKNPVLAITNKDANGIVKPLAATFTNCLIFGDYGSVNDEIALDNGVAALVGFNHCLYNSANSALTGNGNIVSQDPAFILADVSKRAFNFRLLSTSPAINVGDNTTLLIDLDGKPRSVGTKPDIGCYEFQ